MEDDEYHKDAGKNYYGIAHTVREGIHEQPSILVNGKLKEYQVGLRVIDILTIFYMYMCIVNLDL